MKSRLLRALGLMAWMSAGLFCLPPATASGSDAVAAAAKSSARGVVKVLAPSPGGNVVVGARGTSIVGAAWKHDNTPVPGAHVRLRNVVSGKIVASTVANELGQFAFTDVESGTYIVELVSESGKLEAVGHPFTIGPGESVSTFIRLSPKDPWFDGFFRNAAAAVSAAAASTGLTAIAPEKRTCVSACAGQ
jgi:hypothetical protein